MFVVFFTAVELFHMAVELFHTVMLVVGMRSRVKWLCVSML